MLNQTFEFQAKFIVGFTIALNMSRETKKSTVASHFQKVDGEGYVCQIEKMAMFVEPN